VRELNAALNKNGAHAVLFVAG